MTKFKMVFWRIQIRSSFRLATFLKIGLNVFFSDDRNMRQDDYRLRFVGDELIY